MCLVTDGLHEGDRVALLVPGSQAYLDAVLSLLARGIFPVPLDPRLTAYERDRILGSLSPGLVIESGSDLDRLTRASGLPLARPMHVTSGTTGVPKGVYSGVLSEPDAA
ncbi:MAG: AMP-dependent synthetase and ligase, partial [Nocardioides sp.]|nr:AMP-dependent synthetase and ligase [Nocardioides sp.]